MSLPRFLPACLVFTLIAVCACDGGYSGKKPPVAAITDFILTRVNEHRGEQPFDDDITLFAIRVK